MRRAGLIGLFLLLAVVAYGSIFFESSNYIWDNEIGVSGADDVSGNAASNSALFQKYKLQLAQQEIQNAPSSGTALTKMDPFHRGNAYIIEDIVENGNMTWVKGYDEVPRTMVTVGGELNGKAGFFEWIVDESGNLVHSSFNVMK